MQQYQNSLHFQFFPISVEGGGGGIIENQFFPKFKIVQIILGGGQENYGIFPQSGTFFVLKASLNEQALTLEILFHQKSSFIKKIYHSQSLKTKTDINIKK